MLPPRNFCCHINILNVLPQFWLTAYETDWTQKDKAGAIFSPRRHICLVLTVLDTFAAQQPACLQSVSQMNNVQLHQPQPHTGTAAGLMFPFRVAENINPYGAHKLWGNCHISTSFQLDVFLPFKTSTVRKKAGRRRKKSPKNH